MERSGADELSHLPVFLAVGRWHPTTARGAAAGMHGRLGEVSTQGFGKWVSICFSGPDNKRKNNKKPGQTAALVKADDTGVRNKHEGLHGRSWGCRGPLGPA